MKSAATPKIWANINAMMAMSKMEMVVQHIAQLKLVGHAQEDLRQKQIFVMH